MTKLKQRVYYPFVVKGYICMAVPSHGMGCIACVVIGSDLFSCHAFAEAKQYCNFRGMNGVFKVVRKQPKRSISLRGKSSAKSNE